MSDFGTSQTNSKDGHKSSSVDIQGLADSMDERRKASISNLRRKNPPTIYRVPQSIRQPNWPAYEPQIVSIGPYHHGKRTLQGMEKHKWRYLDSILERNPLKTLKDYINEMVKCEYVVRSCYSDDVHWGRTEFVEMIVLDGCFIVEFFIKLKEDLLEMDPVFGSISTLVLVGYDMLLLENQIPFFVLQKIFNMALKPQPKYSLVDVALDFFFNFFHEIMPTTDKITMITSGRLNDLLENPIHHLLHLFHLHLIPTTIINQQSNLSYNPMIKSITVMREKLLKFLRSKVFFRSSINRLPITNLKYPQLQRRLTTKMIPCASDLERTGVKFKKKWDGSSMLDVKFSNGVLEIPPLLVNSCTSILFQNLLMFEQCYPNARICFTTYILFMDCIINTSEDVELLRCNGIIDHLMGKDEHVAHLFNRLGYGIFDFQNNYLSGLYKDVREHYKSTWSMCYSLGHRYFVNPWVAITSTVAIAVILSNIIQTFFTVFPYFRPNSSS